MGFKMTHEHLLDAQAIDILSNEISTKMPIIDNWKVIQARSKEDNLNKGIYCVTIGKTQLGAGVVAKAQLIEACKGRVYYDINITDQRDMDELKKLKTRFPKFGEEYAVPWAVKNLQPDLLKELYRLNADMTVLDVYTGLNIF